jgi:nucleoside-diphosphate-sugar epimerase
LDFAHAINAPFHFTSTAYVHGNRTGELLEDEVTCPPSFSNAYEESKFKGEEMVRKWHDTVGIDYIIYRPSLMVDTEGEVTRISGYYVFVASLFNLRHRVSAFADTHPKLSTLFGITKQGERIHIRAPLLYARDANINIVPVSDVVQRMLLIGTRSGAVNSTYQLVNDDPLLVGTLLKIICDELQLDIRLVPVSERKAVRYLRSIEILAVVIPALKRFARKIVHFRHYMTRQFLFSTKNTQRVLGDPYEPKAAIDENEMSTLTRTFISKLSHTR